MQQEGGGGGGRQQAQYGEMSGAPTTGGAVSDASELLVEAASPISSRPPAAGGNLDELGLGDRGGGGGGGAASGNRWPRQETLALLKIRSDMDATFRDASVKGPLWEDVSRKLAELGYKRSAKKCREKFENVHKYYKRTKEARAGRQDGKSYKFFSQLEALHTTSATAPPNVTPAIVATAASLDVAPVSVGIPMPVSSARIPPTTATMSSSFLVLPGSAPAPVPMQASAPVTASVPPIVTTTTAVPFGISFSSNSSTFSQGFDDDDDEEDDVGVGGEPSSMAGTSRKRKRSSSTRRKMEFFEDLMKQVMQKQEAMQRRFLEVIEKREQDRTVREEAWKRQEMARLAGEHELLAQERAMASSRDAAIISFLQKSTNHTIQLPATTVTIPAAPPPPPSPPPTQPDAPIPTVAPPSHQPLSLPQQQPEQLQQMSHALHIQHQQQQQQQPPPSHALHIQYQQHQLQAISSEVVMAIPEQQVPPQEIGGIGSMEPASSRWPKAEVLVLINLRSGLEARYQEAVPKGPLWEEISAGMSRMGYKRSAKRCKEKWENINKYFKKVKESNKKRPEDAKTCPYFHQLDALYRKKILGGGTSSGSFSDHNRTEEESSRQHQDTKDPPQSTAAPTQFDNETEPNADGVSKKPVDTVRELMGEQGEGLQLHQQHHQVQSFLVDGYDKIHEADSDNMDDEVDEDDGEESEEESKMDYKIEFQKQNSSTPNGGGNGAGAPSFFTMVQ
ncbi:Trihelix transcription factor GTL1 [Hibiscus syriacus]|uniref:Trihelix transcription factor GTL1 n=1 Tax=Hibiscus syriacus TaxID=106335 RepID=A0A6A2WNH1_HIBSY|nr:trihelix transcription factor GTL1-like [Hibiscus syriacus]KAE8661993.1 Trihelix transcription factor GTL1 [Hibiscus syriacus]